jgi:surface polysaccharide O-acyltransferase-like enzyme
VGNYFHLWFVGALLVGTLGQWFFRQLGGRRLLDLVSLGLMAAALLSDSYDLFFGKSYSYDPFRLLLGIPMVHLGMRIAANGRSGSGPWFWFSIAALGLLVQFAEAHWISRRFSYPAYEHQLLLGTLLCAIPLFIGSSLISMPENAVVRLGREYSLAIYLYHPLVFYALALLGNRLWPDAKTAVESFSPLIAFFASLLVLMAIRRFAPRIFRFLNGDLQALWSGGSKA